MIEVGIAPGDREFGGADRVQVGSRLDVDGGTDVFEYAVFDHPVAGPGDVVDPLQQFTIAGTPPLDHLDAVQVGPIGVFDRAN